MLLITAVCTNDVIGTARVSNGVFSVVTIISEMTEDRVKITINSLYKVIYELSVAAKMYDHE